MATGLLSVEGFKRAEITFTFIRGVTPASGSDNTFFALTDDNVTLQVILSDTQALRKIILQELYNTEYSDVGIMEGGIYTLPTTGYYRRTFRAKVLYINGQEDITEPLVLLTHTKKRITWETADTSDRIGQKGNIGRILWMEEDTMGSTIAKEELIVVRDGVATSYSSDNVTYTFDADTMTFTLRTLYADGYESVSNTLNFYYDAPHFTAEWEDGTTQPRTGCGTDIAVAVNTNYDLSYVVYTNNNDSDYIYSFNVANKQAQVDLLPGKSNIKVVGYDGSGTKTDSDNILEYTKYEVPEIAWEDNTTSPIEGDTDTIRVKVLAEEMPPNCKWQTTDMMAQWQDIEVVDNTIPIQQTGITMIRLVAGDTGCISNYLSYRLLRPQIALYYANDEATKIRTFSIGTTDKEPIKLHFTIKGYYKKGAVTLNTHKLIYHNTSNPINYGPAGRIYDYNTFSRQNESNYISDLGDGIPIPTDTITYNTEKGYYEGTFTYNPTEGSIQALSLTVTDGFNMDMQSGGYTYNTGEFAGAVLFAIVVNTDILPYDQKQLANVTERLHLPGMADTWVVEDSMYSDSIAIQTTTAAMEAPMQGMPPLSATKVLQRLDPSLERPQWEDIAPFAADIVTAAAPTEKQYRYRVVYTTNDRVLYSNVVAPFHKPSLVLSLSATAPQEGMVNIWKDKEGDSYQTAATPYIITATNLSEDATLTYQQEVRYDNGGWQNIGAPFKHNSIPDLSTFDKKGALINIRLKITKDDDTTFQHYTKMLWIVATAATMKFVEVPDTEEGNSYIYKEGTFASGDAVSITFTNTTDTETNNIAIRPYPNAEAITAETPTPLNGIAANTEHYAEVRGDYLATSTVIALIVKSVYGILIPAGVTLTYVKSKLRLERKTRSIVKPYDISAPQAEARQAFIDSSNTTESSDVRVVGWTPTTQFKLYRREGGGNEVTEIVLPSADNYGEWFGGFAIPPGESKVTIAEVVDDIPLYSNTIRQYALSMTISFSTAGEDYLKVWYDGERAPPQDSITIYCGGMSDTYSYTLQYATDYGGTTFTTAQPLHIADNLWIDSDITVADTITWTMKHYGITNFRLKIEREGQVIGYSRMLWLLTTAYTIRLPPTQEGRYAVDAATHEVVSIAGALPFLSQRYIQLEAKGVTAHIYTEQDGVRTEALSVTADAATYDITIPQGSATPTKVYGGITIYGIPYVQEDNAYTVTAAPSVAWSDGTTEDRRGVDRTVSLAVSGTMEGWQWQYRVASGQWLPYTMPSSLIIQVERPGKVSYRLHKVVGGTLLYSNAVAYTLLTPEVRLSFIDNTTAPKLFVEDVLARPPTSQHFVLNISSQSPVAGTTYELYVRRVSFNISTAPASYYPNDTLATLAPNVTTSKYGIGMVFDARSKPVGRTFNRQQSVTIGGHTAYADVTRDAIMAAKLPKYDYGDADFVKVRDVQLGQATYIDAAQGFYTFKVKAIVPDISNPLWSEDLYAFKVIPYLHKHIFSNITPIEPTQQRDSIEGLQPHYSVQSPLYNRTASLLYVASYIPPLLRQGMDIKWQWLRPNGWQDKEDVTDSWKAFNDLPEGKTQLRVRYTLGATTTYTNVVSIYYYPNYHLTIDGANYGSVNVISNTTIYNRRATGLQMANTPSNTELDFQLQRKNNETDWQYVGDKMKGPQMAAFIQSIDGFTTITNFRIEISDNGDIIGYSNMVWLFCTFVDALFVERQGTTLYDGGERASGTAAIQLSNTSDGETIHVGYAPYTSINGDEPFYVAAWREGPQHIVARNISKTAPVNLPDITATTMVVVIAQHEYGMMIPALVLLYLKSSLSLRINAILYETPYDVRRQYPQAQQLSEFARETTTGKVGAVIVNNYVRGTTKARLYAYKMVLGNRGLRIDRSNITPLTEEGSDLSQQQVNIPLPQDIAYAYAIVVGEDILGTIVYSPPIRAFNLINFVAFNNTFSQYLSICYTGIRNRSDTKDNTRNVWIDTITGFTYKVQYVKNYGGQSFVNGTINPHHASVRWEDIPTTITGNNLYQRVAIPDVVIANPGVYMFRVQVIENGNVVGISKCLYLIVTAAYLTMNGSETDDLNATTYIKNYAALFFNDGSYQVVSRNYVPFPSNVQASFGIYKTDINDIYGTMERIVDITVNNGTWTRTNKLAVTAKMGLYVGISIFGVHVLIEAFSWIVQCVGNKNILLINGQSSGTKYRDGPGQVLYIERNSSMWVATAATMAVYILKTNHNEGTTTQGYWQFSSNIAEELYSNSGVVSFYRFRVLSTQEAGLYAYSRAVRINP